MSPSDLVQEQLDAYNARDLHRFLAVYSDDIRLYRGLIESPVISGKAALAEFYRAKRFCIPTLRAELLSRQASGCIVVDHERVSGLAAQPVEALLVFRISGSSISEVWAFDPAS